jgi:hypothetical protein
LPRGAPPASSSYFETYYLDGKIFLRGDLALQPLERGTVKLLDLSAMEARQMEMVLLCLDLVIMLFPVQMHQVQLIDQPQAFEQFKGPVHGRAIDVGVPLASASQQRGSVKMGVRLLDGFDQRAPLRGQTNASCLYLVQQIAAFRHLV